MRQPLYILSACSISTQHTYDEAQFLRPAMEYLDGRLFVLDPDYTRYINPVAIRRMSRMLKRGITAGMKCLEDAGISSPDAIITGTARGSVTDMEHFLHDMINMNEEALNPTAFIQSTYNAVNGWLAMLTKSTSYNQTYVHRGFSMELPLFDAQLFLGEAEGTKNVLAGAFEELTPEYYSIRKKIQHYKDETPPSLSLLQHYDTPGSIAGEGAHFFTLSNRPGNACCAIHTLEMLHSPDADMLTDALGQILAENGLTPSDIDVLMCGMNGDSRNASLIDPLLAQFGDQTTVAAFKHLCGEYDTASGFGLWLCHYIFKYGTIPNEIIHKRGSGKAIRNILQCNVTINNNLSLVLLKSCRQAGQGL